MNGRELLEVIGTRRKSICQMILANPEKFCVCEGCSSVLKLPIGRACHHCGAYRYDFSREGVLAMAAISGDKPLATGCGTLPRFVAQLNHA